VSVSRASRDLSPDLKRRGWKFVGATTMHALIQAMGLVNDHADGCVTRARVQEARQRFERP
jgi:DNA-3-methyladenine glycosylase I